MTEPVKVGAPGLKWFSPLSAALFSALIAAASILFPEGVYSAFLGEPDLTYLNATVILFVSTCLAMFVAGVLLARVGRRRGSAWTSAGADALATRNGNLTLVMVMSILFLLANTYLLYKIISVAPVWELLGLVRANDELRVIVSESIAQMAGMHWIVLYSQGVACWLLWTVEVSRGVVSRRRRRVLWGLFVLLAASSSLATFASQSRGILLSFLLGLFMIHILYRSTRKRVARGSIVVFLAVFALLGLAYFASSQVARVGEGGAQVALRGVVGYSVGSYNRLAALMNDTLYLGSPGGYYWTQWIWDAPFLRGWSGSEELASRLFGALPSFGATARTASIWRAGLNRDLTAVTAFGMSYVDFGWYGVLPFFLYGITSEWLWTLFLRRNVWGIMLYPAAFWSVLELRGYLEIARSDHWYVLTFTLFIQVVLLVTPSRRRSSRMKSLSAPPRYDEG